MQSKDTELLEEAIAADPSAILPRLSLVKAYMVRPFDRIATERRAEHLCWLVAHAPHAEIANVGFVSKTLHPIVYERVSNLWKLAISRFPEDTAVLWNAAMFVGGDISTAEPLLRLGASLETTNPRWLNAIGVLYLNSALSESSEERSSHLAAIAKGTLESAVHVATTAECRSDTITAIVRAASIVEDWRPIRLWGQELLSQLSKDDRRLHYVHVALGNEALSVKAFDVALTHLDESLVSVGIFGAGEYHGPDFTLARRLLRLGYRDPVLRFLDGCEERWPYPTHIQLWREELTRGAIPDFRIHTAATP